MEATLAINPFQQPCPVRSGPEKEQEKHIMTYYSLLAVTPTSVDWIPDYLPHLKVRTDGSISHHFLIEGKDDLA
jgi:hypothetical protein